MPRKSKSPSARPKSKPTTRKPQAKPRPGRAREITGLGLLFLGVASLLGLISFTQPSNWMGPVGAFLARTLLGAVGVGAYPVVVGVLLVSILWILDRRVQVRFLEYFCGFGLFVSSLVLLSLFVKEPIQLHPAGGRLGVSLSEFLVSLFSIAGSAILAGAILLACFAVLADVELRRILELIGRSGKVLATPVLAGVEKAQEAIREAREAREIARAEIAAEREERLRQRVDALKAEALDEEEEYEDEYEEDEDDIQEEPPAPPVTRRGRASQALPKEAPQEKPRQEIVIHDTQQETARRLKEEAQKEASLPPSPAQEEPPKGKKAARKSAKAAPEPALEPEEEEPLLASEPELSESEEEEEEDAPPPPRPTAKPAKAPPTPTIVEPKFQRKPIPEEEPRRREDPFKEYQLPPLSFFDYKEPSAQSIDRELLTANARKLEQKLLDYHVPGNVVEIHPGPVITLYEFAPAPGIKISKIAGLSDDLAMALEAERVRIIAPIPGKSVVGIEIPNAVRETVYLKEILADPSFKKSASKLTLGLGKAVDGTPRVADLAKMPHLLVAGATGSGKSVAVNTMICSILYNASPKEVRFLMVDPKMLELSIYEGIPHLLLPVVTDMKKAALALRWAVDEMERRYQLLAEAGVRNIANYNKKIEQRLEEMKAQEKTPAEGQEEGSLLEGEATPAPEAPEPLPYIVVIIDELADLMMVASRDVETSIARLAQMARAAGIHLILATQRPSVDVITGLIKANFPTRISFQVASKIDSRTILDQQGAENLLGMGDMLLMERGKVVRLHGALVLEEEIHKIVEFLKQQGTPQYDETILAPRDDEDGKGEDEEDVRDALYDQAVAIVVESRQASTSMVQRKLRIGYNRAARLIERMEREGIVGPADGAKPREVLVSAIE